jgi:hypothetical protein
LVRRTANSRTQRNSPKNRNSCWLDTMDGGPDARRGLIPAAGSVLRGASDRAASEPKRAAAILECYRVAAYITSHGVTGPQSAALTCARRKPLAVKIGLRRRNPIQGKSSLLTAFASPASRPARPWCVETSQASWPGETPVQIATSRRLRAGRHLPTQQKASVSQK